MQPDCCYESMPIDKGEKSMDNSALKLEVNHIIWMFADRKLTLVDAEVLALRIFDLIKATTPGGSF